MDELYRLELIKTIEDSQWFIMELSKRVNKKFDILSDRIEHYMSHCELDNITLDEIKILINQLKM